MVMTAPLAGIFLYPSIAIPESCDKGRRFFLDCASPQDREEGSGKHDQSVPIFPKEGAEKVPWARGGEMPVSIVVQWRPEKEGRLRR